MSHLGVIAEDDTDCDVITVLARRVTGRTDFGIQRRRGEGCSQIPRKAEMWMKDLAKRGCAHVVIVHDLDRHPETKQLRDRTKLSATLHALAVPAGLERLVCIPIEEMEAWFWSDDAIVKKVGRGKGNALASPHLLAQPKEALARLSRDEGKKPLYSTNDNKALAQDLDLTICAQKCPEFASLSAFFRTI